MLLFIMSASLLFLAHQINETIQHGRVAVYSIATPDGIRVIVGDALGPFFVPGRIAPIPVLELDGVGKDLEHGGLFS